MRYTIILDPDPEEGGYSVTVPALPGCITEGDTFEEAIANAREAITGFVKALHKLGEPIPWEDHGFVVVTVEVAVPVAEAVA